MVRIALRAARAGRRAPRGTCPGRSRSRPRRDRPRPVLSARGCSATSASSNVRDRCVSTDVCRGRIVRRRLHGLGARTDRSCRRPRARRRIVRQRVVVVARARAESRRRTACVRRTAMSNAARVVGIERQVVAADGAAGELGGDLVSMSSPSASSSSCAIDRVRLQRRRARRHRAVDRRISGSSSSSRLARVRERSACSGDIWPRRLRRRRLELEIEVPIGLGRCGGARRRGAAVRDAADQLVGIELVDRVARRSRARCPSDGRRRGPSSSASSSMSGSTAATPPPSRTRPPTETELMRATRRRNRRASSNAPVCVPFDREQLLQVRLGAIGIARRDRPRRA